jgi:hypothetical protein
VNVNIFITFTHEICSPSHPLLTSLSENHFLDISLRTTRAFRITA